jgi:WD40-like Beta Propeller Repeat
VAYPLFFCDFYFGGRTMKNLCVASVLVLLFSGIVFAEWSEPILHDELNGSSGAIAERPWVSSDGLDMYYIKNYKLQHANRPTVSSVFSPTGSIDELYDGEPLTYICLNEDQTRLYYSENVNSTVKSVIRQASRASSTDPWVDDISFYGIHNNGRYDSHPTLMPDELTMFFHNKDIGIYQATRSSIDEEFANKVLLTEFDSFQGLGSPSISPDGLTIYFHAIADGSTTHDIFWATRGSLSDPFGNFESININTDLFDAHPFISPDGQNLYFSSDRGAEGSGIWVSTVVPEPTTLLVLGMGATVLRTKRRNR